MIKIKRTDKRKWEEIEKAHKKYYEKLIENRSKNVLETKETEELIKVLFGIDDIKVLGNKVSDYQSIVKKYYELIKEVVIKNIYILSIGKKDEFFKLQKEIDKNINNIVAEFNNEITKENSRKCINDIIRKFVDYGQFDSGYIIESNIKGIKRKLRWNRNTLLNMIDIRVCPYCNRQYITSFSENEDLRTTGDADHYLAQSIYPLFELSLYNLIPSCQICNRTFKGNINLGVGETLYPYDENDIEDKLKFDIDIDKDYDDQYKCDVLYGAGFENNIRIKVKEKTKEAEAANKVFKLKEVYQAHNIEVFEMLEKIKFYNDVRKNDLTEISKGMLNELYFEKYLFDFDEEDLGKKPLSKLKKDIYEIYNE